MTLPDDRREGLKPPQFRLRTMLIAVAVISALLALMTSVGPLAAIGLLLLSLSILAHVAGNAIGTRLRELGSRPLEGDSVETPSRRTKTRVPLPASDFAPATRLAAKQPLGRLILIAAAVGFCVGAVSGGALLAWLCWERATLASVVAGGLASGALGGFAGFLVASFCRELLRAHADAARCESPR